MKIENIKKSIKIFIVFIMLFIIGENKVNAYTFTENDYYVILDVQTVGTIKVHIPTNQIENLQMATNGKDIVNTSSNTLYGYFNVGTVEYRVTFNTFGNNTYRETNANYGSTTNDFNVNLFIETNIPQLKNDKSFEDIIKIKYQEIIIIILLFILFMGVLKWLRH